MCLCHLCPSHVMCICMCMCVCAPFLPSKSETPVPPHVTKMIYLGPTKVCEKIKKAGLTNRYYVCFHRMCPSKLGEPVTRRRVYILFLRKTLSFLRRRVYIFIKPLIATTMVTIVSTLRICFFLDMIYLRDVAHSDIKTNRAFMATTERSLVAMYRDYPASPTVCMPQIKCTECADERWYLGMTNTCYVQLREAKADAGQ